MTFKTHYRFWKLKSSILVIFSKLWNDFLVLCVFHFYTFYIKRTSKLKYNNNFLACVYFFLSLNKFIIFVLISCKIPILKLIFFIYATLPCLTLPQHIFEPFNQLTEIWNFIKKFQNKKSSKSSKQSQTWKCVIT